jgi:hypothetical protein
MRLAQGKCTKLLRPNVGYLMDCVEKLLSRIEIEILIRRRPGISNKRSNLMRLRNNNTGIGLLLSGHRLFQHNLMQGRRSGFSSALAPLPTLD